MSLKSKILRFIFYPKTILKTIFKATESNVVQIKTKYNM